VDGVGTVVPAGAFVVERGAYLVPLSDAATLVVLRAGA
jgi:hypothetical protein